jgi:hypothetical protein
MDQLKKSILFCIVSVFYVSVFANLGKHTNVDVNYFAGLFCSVSNSVAKELKANDSSIDIFVITSRNSSEKKFYEKILNEKRGTLFRSDTEIYVIEDPFDREGELGSTGGVLYSLSKLAKEKSINVLMKKRIAVIKAGGVARRMISSSVYANKSLMPFSLEGDCEFINTLYFAVLNSYFLGQKLKSKGFFGQIILCSDQLFLSDLNIKEGVNYFVNPISFENVKRSELIIE